MVYGVGPQTLIAGDMNAGFFGEVPVSELFTPSQIASLCGITAGVARYENEPWLKFSYKRKVLFTPRKPIRIRLSWDDIYEANCVYGDEVGKIVTKDNNEYKVRLMRGALTNPFGTLTSDDRGTKYSEWNRLMLPIHEQALDKSWAFPQFVEDDIPVWNHNFGSGVNGMYTDADLVTDHGEGSEIFCRESHPTSSSNILIRGQDGVSYAVTGLRTSNTFARGWKPVLEYLPPPIKLRFYDREKWQMVVTEDDVEALKVKYGL